MGELPGTVLSFRFGVLMEFPSWVCQRYFVWIKGFCSYGDFLTQWSLSSQAIEGRDADLQSGQDVLADVDWFDGVGAEAIAVENAVACKVLALMWGGFDA